VPNTFTLLKRRLMFCGCRTLRFLKGAGFDVALCILLLVVDLLFPQLVDGQHFHTTEAKAYVLRVPHSSFFEGCGF